MNILHIIAAICLAIALLALFIRELFGAALFANAAMLFWLSGTDAKDTNDSNDPWWKWGGK